MLSPEEREALDSLREHYPTSRAASVSVLEWLQERRGYLSDESLRDAAEYLGVPAAELEGLATFYNLLYRKPVGRHVILLCDSAPCWICGHQEIREHLMERLGVGLGGTTDDGDFTLLPSVCLGDCDHAPVMMVGQDLHRNLTPETVDEILASYSQGTGSGGTIQGGNEVTRQDGAKPHRQDGDDG